MPTPLELLLDSVALALFAVYGALMLRAALAPARRLPAVRFWRTRGLTAFAGYFLPSARVADVLRFRDFSGAKT